MSTPEIDIATHLANTVSGLTLNDNVHYGNVLQPDDYVPHKAVFVISHGGAPPLPYAGCGGIRGEHYHSVQVYVRGNKQDYPEAAALARSIADALNYAAIAGYCECRPTQSGIINLGLDKDGHPVLSLNYELISEE